LSIFFRTDRCREFSSDDLINRLTD